MDNLKGKTSSGSRPRHFFVGWAAVYFFSAVLACCFPGLLSAQSSEGVGEWRSYGYDGKGGRFSPLGDIHTGNVSQLKVAWIFRTGELQKYSGTRLAEKAAFEATPIMIGGTLFFSTPTSRVFAIDAQSGKLKWEYDPEVSFKDEFSEVTSRGVSYWHGKAKGRMEQRIFVATLDARLVALDISTGKPVKDFGKEGVITMRDGVGKISITSPPCIIGNVVVVGSSMGDNYKIDYERGVIRAYDAISGRQLWSWDPIPRSATDTAFKEWRGDKVSQTGAANAWAVISADEKLDLVFIPTSSPSPDYYGGERKGRNNYANSVVALEARTGKIRWSFQVVHHDLWDYDVAAQPLLFEFKKESKNMPAIAIGTKMGHIFILDRTNGKPIFPVVENKVPVSDLPGEESYPTQPVPTRPHPLGLQGVTVDSAWGLTAGDETKARNRIASLKYEGSFTPPSQKGTIVAPSNVGGIHWGGMSFDPVRNILVTNVNRLAAVITMVKRKEADSLMTINPDLVRAETGAQLGTPYILKRDYLFTVDERGMQLQTKPPWGTLVGIGMKDGALLWEKPLGYMLDPKLYPNAREWGSINLGGTLLTKGGLCFVAASLDSHLRAFETSTGALLWEAELPAGGQSTPMSYRFKNRQYIIIAAGGHGKLRTKLGDYLVAYALP
jgi:quinoprotein glucose dehydrogenase